MKVIGLIGRIASGKTVVADYLVKERGARYYRFSDVLRDVLTRLHKPVTRENLQNLGLGLRRMYGDGLLAEILRQDIMDSKAELVVVDGIRYQDEYDMVKSLGGRLIHITAPQETRHRRAYGRGTRGEAAICFEDFRKSEEKETERFIDEIGDKADFVIENTGTVEELKAKIGRIPS